MNKLPSITIITISHEPSNNKDKPYKRTITEKSINPTTTDEKTSNTQKQ